MSKKKRYAVVGTGGRVTMFIDPLVCDYTEDSDLVGLCDLSLTRAQYHQQRIIAQYGYREVPIYAAARFDDMVRETKPDVVIVCTVDATHHEYIVKALCLGCDVVTEKPMTTDEIKCRAIFAAVRETERKVRVSFNMRWGAGSTKVRELIEAGTIGRVQAVNLEYQLNTSHGADYFRRWHSDKSCSGGLLVHKSTHHFDCVNWWIDAIPEEVFAYGGLKFYGRSNAQQRGDGALTQYQRYTGTAAATGDPFALTLDEGALRELYFNAEAETGYLRDRNVFREGIDIEDTMGLLVKYRSGVVLTYSLVAYSPIEGFRVTFTGDRGRLEYRHMHQAHIITGSDDMRAEPASAPTDGPELGMHLRVTPMFQEGYDVPIEVGEGGHGGSDPQLQRQIFSRDAMPDRWARDAGHEQGAASILIGIAANHSMQSGQPVRIDELCPLRAQARRLSELI